MHLVIWSVYALSIICSTACTYLHVDYGYGVRIPQNKHRLNELTIELPPPLKKKKKKK